MPRQSMARLDDPMTMEASTSIITDPSVMHHHALGCIFDFQFGASCAAGSEQLLFELSGCQYDCTDQIQPSTPCPQRACSTSRASYSVTDSTYPLASPHTGNHGWNYAAAGHGTFRVGQYGRWRAMRWAVRRHRHLACSGRSMPRRCWLGGVTVVVVCPRGDANRAVCVRCPPVVVRCAQRPQIILLRDGTDTSQGIGQLISNINACQAIVETVRTTLGPRGMDKLIHGQRGVRWVPVVGCHLSRACLLWDKPARL